MKFTKEELELLPTISSGHFDDLKVDTGTARVWLSRVTVEDGAPYNDQVTVERLVKGKWVITEQYPAEE
jgi:hypothetical protein